MVVGLGNPGKRYAGTPHNVGYAAADALAGRLGCKLRRSFRFKSRLGKARLAGETVLLVKPETYMNSSGMAVGSLLRYYKGSVGDLIVVLDDADLEPGRLRIRPQGGNGGHRGLASVIEGVGSEAFLRIRIGIGRRQHRTGLVDHVLSPLSDEDRAVVDPAVVRAAEAALSVIESGAEAAMNTFNVPVDRALEKESNSIVKHGVVEKTN